jgi:isochorismate pyruvate lyase
MNPEEASTMAEVRACVDAIDHQLVALLAQRFACMRAAARIKTERGHVRDETRKAQVIANVASEAERLGAPPETITSLWDALVEASIAYELVEFDRLKV